MTKDVVVQNSKTCLEDYNMLKTYKILSLLLSYPTQELQQLLPDVNTELSREQLLPEKASRDIQKFTGYYQNSDLTEWQAHYVQLFDFSRAASLHLFEHVKGDSKDRGQAMVDLLSFYKENGLEITTNELPDYLPVFLEFLSTLEKDKASGLLAEPVNVIARIYRKLHDRENLYRHILAAVITLSDTLPKEETVEKIIQEQKPLDLDKEYEDEPVTFGGNNNCSGCH